MTFLLWFVLWCVFGTISTLGIFAIKDGKVTLGMLVFSLIFGVVWPILAMLALCDTLMDNGEIILWKRKE